jgi:hypothetical protein
MMNKAQASLEYFIIFAVIAGLTLISTATFLPQVREAAEGLFNKAAGRISGNAEDTTPPTSVNGIVLPWNINSGMLESRIYFRAGETKTFIARFPSNVNGFDFIYYPMTDFTVTASLQMPLKPDGTHYELGPRVLRSNPNNRDYKVIEDGSGTLFTGLWASYDGSIDFKVSAGGGFVLDSSIYPGDFIITLTADRDGWGFMNTELYP